VTVLLLTSCGGAADEAADPPESSDRSPAGRRDLELKGVRVVPHGSGDRIVLTFAGQGKPGWAARYVDRAVVDGSGEVVDLDGEAILQLDISGTPTQASGTARRVHRSLAGDLVDLHALGAWEGVTQVFLGLDGGRTPFRVATRTTPVRLVVDVE